MEATNTITVEGKELHTPLHAFYKLEKEAADRVCFVQPLENGEVVSFTWKDVGQEVRRMAAYLQSLGFEKGSTIGLLSENCAHWIMADIAILMAGYASVPLYPVLTADSIRQILEHSEAKALFVGKLNGWEAMESGFPDGIHCISFPYSPSAAREKYADWATILSSTAPLEGSPDRPFDDIATIVYTSGTTGKPKGVMHSFKNMACVGELSGDMHDTNPEDRFLSYLPLAHVAERIVVEINFLYRGFVVYFSWSLDTFAEDMRRARPTIFFAVPRIWTKLQQRVWEQVPPKKLDLLMKIPILSGFIINKIRTGMGLQNLRLSLSGAAPLSTDMMAWYNRLGITILEGYGMSENFGYSHCNRIEEERIGTVGPSCPGVVCKIADDGEVLVRSETTMIGYYKEPELTREVLTEDGFLHTGDKGEISANGYLKITGRVKDLFKTSKGKYVSPAPIEDLLVGSPWIEQICVTGPSLTNPIALAVLSDAAAAQIDQPQFKQTLEEELTQLAAETNARLDKHENIQSIVLVKEQWSVENNFMTPTLKIKRNEIDAAYQANFEKWASDKNMVVWAS